MKKVLEKIRKYKLLVVGIIIGGILFGGGVYAAVIGAGDVSYSNATSGIAANNVQKAVDALYTKAKDAEAKCPDGNHCFFALPGDYVKMTPPANSYTIPTSMTGYSSTQTIIPNELSLWRVIALNSDGTIDMVSESLSSRAVYFNGKIGYINFISSLNKIAEQYKNSNYTVRTRYMGYNGQTEVIGSGLLYVTDKSRPPHDIYGNSEFMGLGDTGYETDYNLVKSVFGTLQAYMSGTSTTKIYWLASRKYTSSDQGSGTYSWSFAGRAIDSSGDVNSFDMSTCHNDICTDHYGLAWIRPIVTLKSGLSPSGSGTSSDPYVLA